MYVVLGATGHVGSEVLKALQKSGTPVLALVHTGARSSELESREVSVAVCDVRDTDALRATLRRGTRAFLLNPSADPSTDTNRAELATAQSIAEALRGSDLEKVVVQSTYGAQAGDAIGDMSVLHRFEQLVLESGIPTAINRCAYYFTNLEMFLEQAATGTIVTPFPPNLKIPMVAPADLGKAAASRLASSVDDVGIQYIEGPRRYSFADVAAALSEKLGTPVEVETIPRAEWASSFQKVGFSPEAARSYARMTAATINGEAKPLKEPPAGEIDLRSYLAGL